MTAFFSLPLLKLSMDPNSAPRSPLLDGAGVGRGEGGAAAAGGGGAGEQCDTLNLVTLFTTSRLEWGSLSYPLGQGW